MRLIPLGAAGSFPTPRRSTNCLYLPEHGIVIDAGTGVAQLPEAHGDGPLDILMTHWHADHSAGLYFLSARPFAGRPNLGEPEIRVWGPPGIDAFAATAAESSPLFPIPFPFPLQPAPPQWEIRGVKIRRFELAHSSPVYGYRLEMPGGETIAVVTDTTAPGNYLDEVAGVDILVHECSFSGSQSDLARLTAHSDAQAVAELAQRASPGCLLLSHLVGSQDEEALLAEVRTIFPNSHIPVEGREWNPDANVDARIAIFPGSFDPLTVSHLDIINSCLAMFHSLHVVVAANPLKDRQALFQPAERAALIARCVPPRVRTAVWDGLTVEYARQVRAGTIVRGLGRAEDYTVEVRLWKANAMLGPEISTVWVPPAAAHLDVSSSLIKEASLFGGWDRVCELTPEPIRAQVGERLCQARRGLARLTARKPTATDWEQPIAGAEPDGKA